MTKQDFVGKVAQKSGLSQRDASKAVDAFLDRTLFELRRGLDRGYATEENNLATLRGKLVLSRHVALNAAQKTRFFCRHDVLTETTADFAWTLLMAAARRVVEADHYARSGQWKAWKWDLLWGLDVHGKTLGVLGFGRIGRAVARRAGGFGM